jgi:transcriptional regulator with GAF, ATPase, and Fis domain
MPYLLPPDGEPLELYRPLSIVGTGEGCDLRLAPSEGVERGHFQLLADGTSHRLLARAATRVNGAKVREVMLCHGDRIDVGPHQLVYQRSLDEGAQAVPSPALDGLLRFARRVQAGVAPSELLEVLLGECVSLAEADSGFVVLLEDDGAHVAARAGDASDTSEPVLLSDTLLKEVKGRERPLLVADVLQDERLANAQSVIDLQLKAAICLPLHREGALRGLIHLGCARAVHRFDPATLQVLEIFSAQAAVLVHLAERLESLEAERAVLRSQLDAVRSGRLIGTCSGMVAVFERIDKIASSDAPVLILGETGTGKELVAREIHDRSPRRRGAFVAINCGAIPGELLESELFGHRKGAFTGATRDRAGRLVEADGGTLLLDEIGEMPPPLQVKLLRVLQDGEVTPVGGDRSVPVDLRILSATHVDLEKAIAEGKFREDLFYRLRVVDVILPPLRDRDQDLLLLANAFLHEADPRWKISADGIDALLAHRWPGNVRELQNRVRRAVLLADPESSQIGPADLGLDPVDSDRMLPMNEAVERFRRRMVLDAVARCAGNRSEAARQLGVDPRTVFRYLQRHDGGQEP